MANFNLNKVTLGGRLTADPELKQTQSGVSVVSIGIAVNRRFSGKDGQQPEVDFFNVIAWRERADFIARYFRKGSSICIVGTIQNSSWVDRQDVKHYRTDIIADEVYFVDSKSDNGGNDSGEQQAAPSFNTATPTNFETLNPDDDLPF